MYELPDITAAQSKLLVLARSGSLTLKQRVATVLLTGKDLCYLDIWDLLVDPEYPNVPPAVTPETIQLTLYRVCATAMGEFIKITKHESTNRRRTFYRYVGNDTEPEKVFKLLKGAIKKQKRNKKAPKELVTQPVHKVVRAPPMPLVIPISNCPSYKKGWDQEDAVCLECNAGYPNEYIACKAFTKEYKRIINGFNKQEVPITSAQVSVCTQSKALCDFAPLLQKCLDENKTCQISINIGDSTVCKGQ